MQGSRGEFGNVNDLVEHAALDLIWEKADDATGSSSFMTKNGASTNKVIPQRNAPFCLPAVRPYLLSSVRNLKAFPDSEWRRVGSSFSFQEAAIGLSNGLVRPEKKKYSWRWNIA